MKKLLLYTSGLIGFMLMAAGCQKEVMNRTSNLPALDPVNLDLNCRYLENRTVIQAGQFCRSGTCCDQFTSLPGRPV